MLRGAGGEAFASGADISEFEQQRADASQKQTCDEIAARGHAGLAALSKPLIAMIESRRWRAWSDSPGGAARVAICRAWRCRCR